MTQTNDPNPADSTQRGQFGIQRIYVKDISFETPNSPAIFREQWTPAVNLELHSESKALEPNVYEVVISITVTVKVGELTAFLAEVRQAGIFSIQGLDAPQLGPTLGAFCPNILFPYAREAVSDLVVRGGFPPLYIAPVNFDALYAEQVRRHQQTQQAPASGAPH
jgi:preprotein translocase subunit SecB